MALARPWIGLTAAITLIVCGLPGLAAAVSVRLGVTPERTRLVIDSKTPLALTPEDVGGERLVFALAGAADEPADAGPGQGLVKNWRLANVDGLERLTLNLTAPARVVHRFAIDPKAPEGRYRYVIDLAGEGPDRLVPARAPTGSVRVLAADPSFESTPRVHPSVVRLDRRRGARTVRKVIVIDAGHGGQDPGARGDGVNEKDVTLAAALRLRRLLLAEGRYRVVMTRSSDVFVPLEERVRIARRAGADLFIALHADSAGDNDTTHGASVYTLSGQGETRVREVLTGHEWFNRAAPRGDSAVKGILLDLTQRSTLNRSNLFAQMLVERLSQSIDVLPRTHRDAGYFVLLAPDVPAVLLEMGFITSPRDAARLTSSTRRNALMDTVAQTIDAYFDGGAKLAANPATVGA